AFRTLAQLAGEPVGRGGDGGEEWLARIRPGWPGALGDRDPDTSRDFAHRGRIVHAEPLHEERVDVAGFVTDEAVEHPLFGNDGEVAMCATVEGTAAAVVRAGALQFDSLADDPDEIGGLAHLLDAVVGDHAV